MIVAAALAGVLVMAGLALGIAELTRQVPAPGVRCGRVRSAAPPPSTAALAPVTSSPPTSLRDISLRDISLRDILCDLSERLAEAGDQLPQIVGIHLTTRSVDILLSAPAVGPPPQPFSIAPGRQGTCWTAGLGEVPPDWATAPPMPGEVGDLLPGLFSAGVTDADGYLLLDLETVRVTCCDGPAELVDRLLVTAITDLAASRWSGWYDLIVVGCDEMEVFGRADRCRGLDEAIDLLARRVSRVRRKLENDRQADVRTRRMVDPDDEDWGLTLLVSRLRPTAEQISRLLDLVAGQGGIAALVAGDVMSEQGELAPAVFRLEPDLSLPGAVVLKVALRALGSPHRFTVRPEMLTVTQYKALVIDHDLARPVSEPDAPGPENMPELEHTPEPADWPEPTDARMPPDDEPPSQGRLSVTVLGPVQVVGTVEQLQAKQAELVLALALHSPVGLSNSALCTLLGVDADHPRPADSVRQLITRTRRRLGRAADGGEVIIHLGSGIYALHEGVGLDWTDFSALARRGRAERSAADLRAALALVRGQPFEDCYHWWIDVGLVERMRAEIVDSADLLAQLELAAGHPDEAGRAARVGLSAEPAAEQLWRALMRAEHAVGNAAGVADAWSGCLDAISEIAPGGEPHPDTERLYQELSCGAQPLRLRG